MDLGGGFFFAQRAAEHDGMAFVVVPVLHGDKFLGVGESLEAGIGEDVHDLGVGGVDVLGEGEGLLHGGDADDVFGMGYVGGIGRALNGNSALVSVVKPLNKVGLGGISDYNDTHYVESLCLPSWKMENPRHKRGCP